MEQRIAEVGLGYVGLPIAMAFARGFEKTIGFDPNVLRVESLKRGVDATGASVRTLRREARRTGDVPHSLECIDRARGSLGYQPEYHLSRGLQATIGWYATRLNRSPVRVPGTIDASPPREQHEPLAHG